MYYQPSSFFELVLLLYSFATLEMRGELEPKYIPQLLLGSLLGEHRSAIGQFFPLSLVTVPEVFAEVYSVQFPSRFNS